MNIKIKKVIAREGLIILPLLVSSIVSFVMMNHFEKLSSKIRYSGGLYEVTEAETNRKFIIPGNNKNLESRANDVVNNSTLENQEQYIQEKYGQEIVVVREMKRMNKFKNYSMYSGLFFLLAAYPLYLLIRFITRAVKTQA